MLLIFLETTIFKTQSTDELTVFLPTVVTMETSVSKKAVSGLVARLPVLGRLALSAPALTLYTVHAMGTPFLPCSTFVTLE